MLFLSCGRTNSMAGDVGDSKCAPPLGVNEGGENGELMVSGTVRDASGTPVVGASIEIEGSTPAVRFSNFTGSYFLHVGAGSHTLLGRQSGCALSPERVDFEGLEDSKTQDFTATGPDCVTAKPSNAIQTGMVVTLSDSTNTATTYVNIIQHGHERETFSRLQQIADELPDVPFCELTIGGFPAMERVTTVTSSVPAVGTFENIAITTAIAVGTEVVRFESLLAPDAPRTLIDLVRAAGRNFTREQIPDLHTSN